MCAIIEFDEAFLPNGLKKAVAKVLENKYSVASLSKTYKSHLTTYV